MIVPMNSMVILTADDAGMHEVCLRGPAFDEIDGTCELLMECGLPLTAENWLMLAFAGHPPEPPYDEELFDVLPDWIRRSLE
jgi:hypothetical protein